MKTDHGLPVLLLGLILVGCTQATEPYQSPSRNTGLSQQASPSGYERVFSAWPDEHSIHLEADVQVVPRTFVTGSPIEIVVSVRNTSHEPMLVANCPLAHAWFDESGAYVGPIIFCSTFPSYELLAPGEKLERRYAQVGYWAPGRYKVYPFIPPLPFQHPFTVRILPEDVSR